MTDNETGWLEKESKGTECEWEEEEEEKEEVVVMVVLLLLLLLVLVLVLKESKRHKRSMRKLILGIWSMFIIKLAIFLLSMGFRFLAMAMGSVSEREPKCSCRV